MAFRSIWLQILVTLALIAVAILLSTVTSGWHWGVLFPAAVIAGFSAFTWHRSNRGREPKQG